MSKQPTYPMADAGDLRSASGKAVEELNRRTLAAGRLSAADMQIDAATLRAQAAVARQAGYGQLADNLARAAELTAVPNETLLAMYEQLRPGRATHAEIEALATKLEDDFAAPITAALVREAAANYRRQGLCKPTPST